MGRGTKIGSCVWENAAMSNMHIFDLLSNKKLCVFTVMLSNDF